MQSYKASIRTQSFIDYKSTFRWLNSDSLYQIHCLVILSGACTVMLVERKTVWYISSHVDHAIMIKPIWSSHYDQAHMIKPIWSGHYDQAIMTKPIWSAIMIKPIWSSQYDQANMIEPIWSSQYDQANMVKLLWPSQYDQAIPMDQQINTLRRGPLRGV